MVVWEGGREGGREEQRKSGLMYACARYKKSGEHKRMIKEGRREGGREKGREAGRKGGKGGRPEDSESWKVECGSESWT